MSNGCRRFPAEAGAQISSPGAQAGVGEAGQDLGDGEQLRDAASHSSSSSKRSWNRRSEINRERL